MSPSAPKAWPGTAGGASSPAWGDSIRLYVWAGIAAGTTMHWGPDPTDRLDAGNVYAGTQVGPPGGTGGQLWVDLTCDVLALETSLGADSADGPIVKALAGTASFTLRDPTRKYDPLNPSSPYQYGGVSRLGPGTSVKIWAELAPAIGGQDLATEISEQLLTEAGDQLLLESPNAPTVTQYPIHLGTVDSWEEEWKASPNKRQVKVVSSDAVKNLTALNRGEQPAVGSGDTTSQRVERILSYYGWAGTRYIDTSAVTEQATTFAQSAWELIGRVADDEIGMVYIDANGILRFKTRALWQALSPIVLSIGCSPSAPTAWDIVLDAQVTAGGAYFANAIFATRTGGTQQSATSLTSIQRYGERSLKRSDLGVLDDTGAGTWASFLLALVAWPRSRIEGVTLRPGIDQGSWSDVLSVDLMEERVQVYWQPPDATATVTAAGRLIGVEHHVTHGAWDVDMHLALADVFGRKMHWGPHPDDRLTAGMVYT